MEEAERIQREYARRERDRRHAGRYRYTDPGHLLMVQERERALLALLARRGLAARLAELRVLDAGCGSGELLLDLLGYGARAEHLTGVDLLPARIAAARARLPAADLRVADAAALPFADRSFDLVCQFVALSSLLDQGARARLAAELWRVLRPGGCLVWYDLRRNNPRNQAVRGIDRAELRRLFPAARIEARSITLAPPIARLVAPRSWLLAEALARLPPLRTHLLAAISADEGRA